MNLKDSVNSFLQKVKEGDIEVYNEISLQHELGIFLRRIIKDKKVQFERNVSHFDLTKSEYIKKEIDISIFADKNILDYAIELKFPRNGQIPKQMFKFCKDILFAEQLVQSGANGGLFLAVVDDHKFYNDNLKTDGIYEFFRTGKDLKGEINKPTGNKDISLKLDGKYSIQWERLDNTYKYLLIEI